MKIHPKEDFLRVANSLGVDISNFQGAAAEG